MTDPSVQRRGPIPEHQELPLEALNALRSVDLDFALPTYAHSEFREAAARLTRFILEGIRNSSSQTPMLPRAWETGLQQGISQLSELDLFTLSIWARDKGPFQLALDCLIEIGARGKKTPGEGSMFFQDELAILYASNILQPGSADDLVFRCRIFARLRTQCSSEVQKQLELVDILRDYAESSPRSHRGSRLLESALSHSKSNYNCVLRSLLVIKGFEGLSRFKAAKNYSAVMSHVKTLEEALDNLHPQSRPHLIELCRAEAFVLEFLRGKLREIDGFLDDLRDVNHKSKVNLVASQVRYVLKELREKLAPCFPQMWIPTGADLTNSESVVDLIEQKKRWQELAHDMLHNRLLKRLKQALTLAPSQTKPTILTMRERQLVQSLLKVIRPLATSFKDRHALSVIDSKLLAALTQDLGE